MRPAMPLRSIAPLLVVLCWAERAPAQAQQPSGWEPTGVPAINYDADEGFGYGVLLELYNYGRDGLRPYLFTLQPTVFLTTGGRRDFTLFFDSPHLLGSGWRIDAGVGSERQIATPYYGLGNDTPFDPALEAGDDRYFYRFGRMRRQASVNVQQDVGELPLRLLFGAGVSHVTIETHPEEAPRTLLAEQLGAGTPVPGGWSNHLRAGLVWDTRDRESGTHRGTWSELLIQFVPELLGSESGYVRWTLTDRRYFPLSPRLTFANRVLLQNVDGTAPFYDLYLVQTSFKQQEGLGGAKTLRGLPKNRYVGAGMLLWNAELRWRAGDFGLLGQPFHVVLSGFVDSGRVWEEGVIAGQLLDDLHTAFGGGVRVGKGENFVVSFDVGHSSQSTASIYINVGYLF